MGRPWALRNLPQLVEKTLYVVYDLVSEYFPSVWVPGTKEVERRQEGDAVSTQMRILGSSHVVCLSQH